MIVVDTTVWVDHLNDVGTPQVALLRATVAADRIPLVVGDLVLLEVLQGVANERLAGRVEAALRSHSVVTLGGTAIAIAAAAHYRRLRGLGITVRRTIDMVIGTFCIAHDLPLLHSDRDFDHMERHLGLSVVR